MFVVLQDGKRLIIEVRVSLDYNTVNTPREKEIKYFNLAEQVRQKSWVYPKILPIVVGCLGAVPLQTMGSLEQLKKLGINVPIARLQRAAIWGSCKVARQVLCSRSA